MKTKTKDIQAKEWFDKVNGNSYFSGIITVDFGLETEKTFKMPFQYGYGSQYESVAKQILFEAGLITTISGLYITIAQSMRRNQNHHSIELISRPTDFQ